MNAADLARLQVAKRAYQAAQPSAAEVQTGVRRARLWLRRPKSRRSWFSKGLVFVVLAIGSLAYAKPHALGELVEVLPHTHARAAGRGARLATVMTTTPDALPKAGGGVRAPLNTEGPAATSTKPAAAAGPKPATPADAKAAATAAGERAAAMPTIDTTAANAARTTTRPASRSATGTAPHAALASSSTTDSDTTSAASAGSETTALSDWGRVGQALAHGDETRALAALSELSESHDPRTRDKADLGRAQLFIAHGDREQGCAVARSLTNRRAGSHIEREAQVLLQGCTR